MKLTKYRAHTPTHHFGHFFDDFSTRDFDASVSRPAVNIIENVDGFKIELAAPGLDKKDFKINVEKDLLTISSEKKQEETTSETNFTRREFNYGTFTKSFHIPDSIDGDKIVAIYENGVLILSLANKPEIKPKRKEIEIR